MLTLKFDEANENSQPERLREYEEKTKKKRIEQMGKEISGGKYYMGMLR